MSPINTQELHLTITDSAELVRAVRKALDMSPAEAGGILFGYPNKHAYDQWTMWENGTKKPSKPTIRFFELVLFLALAKKQHIRGADKALDLFLKAQNKD